MKEKGFDESSRIKNDIFVPLCKVLVTQKYKISCLLEEVMSELTRGLIRVINLIDFI